MDIGTSKPSVNERSLVKHHLFDIIDPDQPFSVALYGNAARSAISDIQSRGNLPVLTGGSGLYIWSLLENWSVRQFHPIMISEKK
jgi:tRNA dimethylallyltransferase